MTNIPPILLVGFGKMGGAMLAGWRERGLAPSVAVDPTHSSSSTPLPMSYVPYQSGSPEVCRIAVACCAAGPCVTWAMVARLRPAPNTMDERVRYELENMIFLRCN